MQKKAIPILITTMLVALCGIIFIQYLWIRKSITEKQALIDNNVIQAISNVDKQLSDFGALAFFRGQATYNHSRHDSLILVENTTFQLPFGNTVTDSLWSTSPKMEVQVITSGQNTADSITISQTQLFDHQNKAESIRIELSQMEDELMRLEEVRTVFDHIRFETNPVSGDFRLDSARIHELLQKEFRSFKLDSAINWGVYDTAKNQFSIQPKEKSAFNYEVPLFKNDVIQPGRYILKLQLVNNASMIWVDIRMMVFLSVIFILIILSVFVVALRLIIKHKKISQIKSDFINNMTHEFKTPLASISLAADSIIHPNVASDQNRIKEYVSIIQQEKTKLNQNVERILEVASLEKDAITFPEEVINLTELIQQTVQNLQLVLQNKGGSISVLLTDSPQIRGSAFHLSQALSNILENSIKYSPKKPDIKISLTQKETRTEIKITDHGIGMTSDQLTKVFDSFYRAEAGNIHNTKGFGLGLTYSKFVIEKMGGKIEINSSLNKGTSVLVHFSKL